jgi:Fur family peroxide stress response transcriptional regulator
MDRHTRWQHIEDSRHLCRERGLPLTPQRAAVLEAVLDLDNHPTADQVHEAVAGKKPGVSRATVYRALESLVGVGAITKACHPGKAVRYDSRTETHHHLVCLRCDEVVDITDERLDALPVPDTSRHGFEVSDFRVQLRGICRRCRELEETP